VLEKSLQALKPGGKLISISGPPDPDFAKDRGSPWILRRVMRLLSYRNQEESKASWRELFISFHEGQRQPVTRDRSPHRFRGYSGCCGSGLPIRIDYRGYGLRQARRLLRGKAPNGSMSSLGATNISTTSSNRRPSAMPCWSTRVPIVQYVFDGMARGNRLSTIDAKDKCSLRRATWQIWPTSWRLRNTATFACRAELGISASALSHALRSLEERLACGC